MKSEIDQDMVKLNDGCLREARRYWVSMRLLRLMLCLSSVWNALTFFGNFLAGNGGRAAVSFVIMGIALGVAYFCSKKEAFAARLIEEAKERKRALYNHRES